MIKRKKFREVREIHERTDGFKELKPCKNCFYPRKMSQAEEAVINGRKVKIESYINRIQVVGK
jgi:hypothetical protein